MGPLPNDKSWRTCELKSWGAGSNSACSNRPSTAPRSSRPDRHRMWTRLPTRLSVSEYFDQTSAAPIARSRTGAGDRRRLRECKRRSGCRRGGTGFSTSEPSTSMRYCSDGCATTVGWQHPGAEARRWPAAFRRSNPLCVFKVVAHTQISPPSLELHVTQPAVSRQVGVLEGYLGAELFQSERHGVTLTRVGRTLIDRVISCAAKEAAARARMPKRAGSSAASRSGHRPAFELRA